MVVVEVVVRFLIFRMVVDFWILDGGGKVYRFQDILKPYQFFKLEC